MASGGRQASLKWQLISRLAIVLGCLMIVVNIGFFLFLLLWLPHAKVADDGVQPDIASAITRADGQLVIKQPELAHLREKAPGLWFVAMDADGKRVSYGQVPEEFRAFLPRLNDLRVIDIRGEDGSSLTAAMAQLTTDAGRMTVLYGGKTPSAPRALWLLWGLKMIYIPFTVAPVLIVFIAIPVIVGRALAGVAKTTSRAAAIDATSLGVRLPKDDVVQELHPLVNAVNAALSRIDEDVSRRQRFLTNAAHELRTPVAILQTRVEALQPGAVRERLLLDVRRLAATAEQLLDIQRFSTIQSWTDVDLVTLCETVAADIAPIAIAAGYEISFESALDTFVVKGDYASLERAVTNLAMNAVEHGGGRGRILVELMRDGTIEISDEGPGIPQNQRDKVFEPFFRVTPKSTGAGLGLSLVHQIVQSHGGHVSIMEQGKGARFRLALGTEIVNSGRLRTPQFLGIVGRA